MIRVGINENVKLKGAELNEKGTLSISFVQDGAPVGAVEDILMTTAGIKPSDGVTSTLLFPPSVEYNGEKRKVEDIAGSLSNLRDQLEHILQGYLTTDAARLDPFTGIDTSDTQTFQSMLLTEAGITRIYNNLATQFVQKVRELGDRLNTELFRLLMIRRSAANHYGTLRARYITNNPFWESMKVPSNASALKFTKYEISKGLNNGDPVAKDATAQPADAGNAGDDILGRR